MIQSRCRRLTLQITATIPIEEAFTIHTYFEIYNFVSRFWNATTTSKACRRFLWLPFLRRKHTTKQTFAGLQLSHFSLPAAHYNTRFAQTILVGSSPFYKKRLRSAASSNTRLETLMQNYIQQKKMVNELNSGLNIGSRNFCNRISHFFLFFLLPLSALQFGIFKSLYLFLSVCN